MSFKRYKTKVTLHGDNFAYVAIHTPLPSHEFNWKILQKTHFTFHREATPVPLIPTSDGHISKHVVFYFKGRGNIQPMWLVKNQGDIEHLMKVKPIPDYILVSQIHSEYEGMEEWIPLLREIIGVNTAYIFPENKVKRMNWVLNLPHLIPSSPESDV